MPNLGPVEIIALIFLALLLFGSTRLPKLGTAVGETIKNLRTGLAEANEDVEKDELGELETENADR